MSFPRLETWFVYMALLLTSYVSSGYSRYLALSFIAVLLLVHLLTQRQRSRSRQAGYLPPTTDTTGNAQTLGDTEQRFESKRKSKARKRMGDRRDAMVRAGDALEREGWYRDKFMAGAAPEPGGW